MAGRPRSLKLPDGEILLKGFSKERASEIEALLFPTKETLLSSSEVVEEPTPLEILSGVSSCARGEEKKTALAIGYSHNVERKMYELVIFKYDPVTLETQIIEKKDCGEYLAFAMNNFKIALVEKGLVK